MRRSARPEILSMWLAAVACAGEPSPGATASTSETTGSTTQAGTTTGGTGDTSGESSSDASTGDAPTADLPPVCEEHADEPESEMTLRITNNRGEDVILFDIDGCGSIESIWQLRSDDMGAWPRPCGLGSCEERLETGRCPGACTLPCTDVGGIRLSPGATYTATFDGRVRHEVELSPECLGDCDDACLWARHLADEELVGVLMRTGSSPTCGGEPCTCTPGAQGWCMTPADDPGTADDPALLYANVMDDAIEVAFE